MEFTYHKNERKFIPVDFKIEDWSKVEPFFIQLLETSVDTETEIRHWLENWSELESVISEDMAWRYIRMTCDTTNEAHKEAYEFFVNEIFPNAAPFGDKLNKKLLASKALETLKGDDFFVLIRSVRKQVELFREENIALYTELKKLESDYGTIAGAMSIEHEGETITLQKAGSYLKDKDRNLRETIFKKISNRRKQDQQKLENLLSSMIVLRHKIAVNAGFENYRDYMFASMGRYDYSPKECENFHQSVYELIMPLKNEQMAKRKKRMQLDALKPWDTKVDATGLPALKPFNGQDDLIQKSIKAFSNIDPYFGACLNEMNNLKQFDLESRLGKAPGGYNYPLAETGAPFIFMNATGTMEDLETMMHEGGHAIHSFLTHPLNLDAFKNAPMEVAEVASMSMELLSMDQYSLFFDNAADINRAKTEQLERSIGVLPWIAAIDKFQHWLYVNHTHSLEERAKKWKEIFSMYTSSEVSWDGLEMYIDMQWQAQLHIYEVPFYYIEYGIAQLGSIGIWKNYCENKQQGIKSYVDMLQVGNTKTLPEIYKTGSIVFDFSAQNISKLTAFVSQKMKEYESN